MAQLCFQNIDSSHQNIAIIVEMKLKKRKLKSFVRTFVRGRRRRRTWFVPEINWRMEEKIKAHSLNAMHIKNFFRDETRCCKP